MNASLYRKFLKVEDNMLRAAMPRTAAADPVQPVQRAAVQAIANRGGRKLVKPLTFKLAEVVR